MVRLLRMTVLLSSVHPLAEEYLLHLNPEQGLTVLHSCPGRSWWLFLSRGDNGRACPCVSAWVLSPFSHIWLFVTLWIVASQASLHGIPQARILEQVAMPSSGDLPNPEMEPASLVSPASPALAGRFFTTSATWETQWCTHLTSIPL